MNPVKTQPLKPTLRGPALSTDVPNGEDPSSAPPSDIQAYHLSIEKQMNENETYRAENMIFQVGKGTITASECRGVMKRGSGTQTEETKSEMIPGKVYEYPNCAHKFNATFQRGLTDDGTDDASRYDLSINTHLNPKDDEFVCGGSTYRLQDDSVWTRENKLEASWEKMEDNLDKDLNTAGSGGSHTACAKPMTPGMKKFIEDSTIRTE